MCLVINSTGGEWGNFTPYESKTDFEDSVL